jgi:hypothetical protein
MTVSLFSRFQGCLLMTFLAAGDEGSVNRLEITPYLNQWSTIFHSRPYQGTLPATVWQNDQLHWQNRADFSRWLVVLALWHHENPVGFQADLGRLVTQFTAQFPDQALSTLDQAWLQLWQRLLTLILSERFTLAQLPDLLLKAPFPPSIKHDCQGDLQAIATALENHQAPVFTNSPAAQSVYAHGLPWSIYCWADTPAQPRLTIQRFRSQPFSPSIVPFTSALSGAYNGEKIVRQALTGPPFAQTSLMSLVNHFAHQHFLQWLGCPSTSSAFSALANAAPLVMQRRSGLKLVSQQDYEQFS